MATEIQFKKKLLLLVLPLFCINAKAQSPVALPAAYPDDAKINYVRTWQVTAPISNLDTVLLDNLNRTAQRTVYIDGLGRPMQTVLKATTPLGKDLVTVNTYDDMGREAISFLPYTNTTDNGSFKTSPFTAQQTYYRKNFADSFPYTITSFEQSPLGRPLTTNAPGKSWAPSSKAVKIQYLYNTTADSIRVWTISSGVPVTSTIYAAGKLDKTKTADEHGKEVEEYKDMEGKVILKKVQTSHHPTVGHNDWLCTYYVYDKLGQLRYVLQPKAVQQLISNSWQFSGNTLSELCFKYEYDELHRMIIKKVPGAGEVWMVYDARRRLVLTQDSVQRAAGEWMVTQYDVLDRMTKTYLWTNSSSRTTHQSSALTSISYPTLSGTYSLLTETYYDNYSWLSGTGLSGFSSTDINGTNFITSYNTSPLYAESMDTTKRTTGLITGIKTKVLNAQSGMPSYIYAATWYDDKGRPIQVQTTNTTGGIDCATTQYDYSGKVLHTLQKHQKSGTNAQTYYVLGKNEYDFAGRLIKVKKTVNTAGGSNAERILAQNSYDELGQLIKKKTGGGLDSLEYEYNIRGWLTDINKAYIKGQRAGWFGMGLGYDADSLGTGASLQYNGNISSVVWKQGTDNVLRKYSFGYDWLNRLYSASFGQYESETWVNSTIDYSLNSMSYDANGNILSMVQKALKIGSSSTIDSLAYSYMSNSNKLVRVTDAFSDATTKLGDFKDGTNGGDDYSYDGNGSMIADSNKHISSIVYNYLNLPQTITVSGKGTIDYVYDAVGNKLEKKTTEGATVTKTDYINGFIYINDSLQYLGHEEGRVRWTKRYWLNGDSTNQFVYDYFIKDHLGNIRTVLTEQRDTAKYMATFETASRTQENALFYNIEETVVSVHDIVDYPEDYTTDPNAYTSKLDGNEHKVGAAITIKVMAGDKVDLGVKYWYPEYSVLKQENPLSTSALFDILVYSMSGGVSGISRGKASFDDLTSPVQTGLSDFLITQDGEPNEAGHPRAFLNWILLDEQFKYVPQGSGFIRVDNYDGDIRTLAQTDLPVIKSGYLFVYLSNQTEGENVYFDNLVVQHYTGPLAESTDYTSWGLDMKMLGSKAFGKIENKQHKYNGYEKNDDLDLNLYESFYRTHDPQLGRFWQVDPKAIDFESPFVFTHNNPILFNDILGDTSELYDMSGNYINTVNDKSGLNRLMVDKGTYETMMENSTYQDADFEDQKVANSFMGEFEKKLGELEKATGKDYISKETGISLTFTGEAKDVSSSGGKIRQLGEGILSVISNFDNGKSVTLGEYSAMSGPGENGLIPNGPYKTGKPYTYNKMCVYMDKNGTYFKIPIIPDKSIGIPSKANGGRFALLIHPVGGCGFSTDGCIGIKKGAASFYNIVGRQTSTKSLNLSVNIKGNANVVKDLGKKSTYHK